MHHGEGYEVDLLHVPAHHHIVTVFVHSLMRGGVACACVGAVCVCAKKRRWHVRVCREECVYVASQLGRTLANVSCAWHHGLHHRGPPMPQV
jgi:hypothetical protein